MYKKQKGLSTVGWALLILVGGSIILCAVKIVPVFVNHLYVNEALRFLVDNNQDVTKLSKENIKGQLSKYGIVNSLGAVQRKSFKIYRHNNHFVVNSAYEVRKNIIANIDVVITFKSQLDTQNPEECCKYLIEDLDAKGR